MYILGIDQSTSGTKAVLVDVKGRIVYKDMLEHRQYYPKPGWVEHDLEEIYTNVVTLIGRVIEKVDPGEIMGLSITNQRETIAFWDAKTKKSLCHAYVWQCRRGLEICQDYSERGYDEIIEKKTGLKLDTYFSASKVKWAMEHEAKVRKAKEQGTLRVGTIDAWLIFRLTQGKVFATDHTNASRTMLYNIETSDWDEELLTLFGAQRGMMPCIYPSNGSFGRVEAPELLKIGGLPIAGVIGDSQGALFGQLCFERGMAKATYGTGSSVMMYTDQERIRSDNGLVTSVAWAMDDQVYYAIEGLINSSGDTLKWVKENLGLYQEDVQVETMIQSLDSNEGVYIVPAFVGLGAPYWKGDAKASIVGLSRKSHRAHIVRAAVESMAYQVSDLIHLMERDAKIDVATLNADGGPTKNKFLMQLQADVIGAKVRCIEKQELSVMGAIYLGGLSLGVWQDFEALKALPMQETIYEPMRSNQEVKALLTGWHDAIESVC
ncbi:glycerol kinase GlpK [Vallitaleaceae bacterium 9-2]